MVQLNVSAPVGMVPKERRTIRRPQHTFRVKSKPHVISPFFLAPVLPGETLKNLLLQARVVTDPLSDSIGGWWCEFYVFYVRHRDIDDTSLNLQKMVLNDSATLTGFEISADDDNFYEEYDVGDSVHGVMWNQLCYRAVVNAYFRDEGEAYTDYQSGTLSIAKVAQSTWRDSLLLSSEYLSPDFDVDTDASTSVEASEVAEALARWNVMRTQGLVDMEFEDYLAAYGVKVPRAELNIPELVRYVREWGYPTNTVDPSTGTPSTAAVFSLRERADKDRFFKEPGFLYGVCVLRPKVYFKLQDSYAASSMRDYRAWLPAGALNDPHIAMLEWAAGEGVLQDSSAAYRWDTRDLFLFGDQMLTGFDRDTATDYNEVSLPAAGIDNKQYPTTTDIDSWFSGSNKNVKADGVVSLSIASHLRNVTPFTPAGP